MANTDGLEAATPFYVHLLQTLQAHNVPFLIGGAFSFAHFTGIRRPTKDLDLFVRQRDWCGLEKIAHDMGYRTELTFAHWLGKVHDHTGFVDVIFNSGNGLSPVDDDWFVNACDAQVLGVQVKLAPVEESLWTKAFIMERERYDGADIAHLLQANAEQLDWAGLLERFGAHWRVLLVHLTLFGYIYPGEQHRVPRWLMETLLGRLTAELRQPPAVDVHVCAGTLLSRSQYLHDVEQLGFVDGRLTPASTMTREDVAVWTEAIPPQQDETGEAACPVSPEDTKDRLTRTGPDAPGNGS